MRLAGPLAHLLAWGPHAGAHRVAARAAISVLVPLLVLVAAERTEWAIYASFGAFTALYGRERVDLDRVALQAVAGMVLTALVGLGAAVAASEQRSWIAVPVTAAVAVGVTIASLHQRWHPPGPLFAVFAFSAVAAVPGRVADVPVAAGVAGAAALFSLLVGNGGAVVRRARRQRRQASSPPEPPIGGAAAGWWRQALLSGTGVALAGTLATGAGIGRPYWAMVSAVVPLVATGLTQQVVRGVHRVVGTGLGLLVAGLLLVRDLPPLVVAVVAAALQAGAELLVGRNYALALVCITPLALVMVHLSAPAPVGELIRDRALETLIGVCVGVAVGFLGRPRRRAAPTLR